MDEKPAIREAVVVEGRDDVAAVTRAVSAVCIPTHGFGIAGETWELIDRAYETKGIIILTDPDHAGEAIRERLSARYPGAKHAFVPRGLASANGDIGIENAAPEDIAEALFNAKATVRPPESPEVTEELMYELGLSGGRDSKDLRIKAAAALGIGYGNARAFMKRANGFGVTKTELTETVNEIKRQSK